MGIEHKFPRGSNEFFLKIFSFLQRWRVLLKHQDAKFFDDQMKTMKSWVQEFWREFDRGGCLVVSL